MAQRANDKNPPRRIMLAEDGDATRELPVKWTSIQRSAWDQRGRDVDVYVRALVIPWEQRALLLCPREFVAPVACLTTGTVLVLGRP
jgi:hypothetical protein